MPKFAGEGTSRVYEIRPTEFQDDVKLNAGGHYIAVDAVAWGLLIDPKFKIDRTAYGTIEIALAGGLENYKAVLGTFELDVDLSEKDMNIAPIFDIPILPDRNYRGGPIVFNISLNFIKKEPTFLRILKSAAKTSLNIVSGMVETAGLKGPSQILTAAGKDVIDGVNEVLSDDRSKIENVFAKEGLKKGLYPNEIIGSETYLLFHKGSDDIEEKDLSINTQGKVNLPFYKNSLLKDGAWVLLKIRRNNEYTGVREWFSDTRILRGRINDLLNDFFSRFISKEEALKSFELTKSGKKTIIDEFIRLRSIIRNDGVLTEREAGFYIGQLQMRVGQALQAIKEENKEIYTNSIERANDAVSKGRIIDGVIGEEFEEEVKSLADIRSSTLVKDTTLEHIASFSGKNLFNSLQYLPKAIKDYKTL